MIFLAMDTHSMCMPKKTLLNQSNRDPSDADHEALFAAVARRVAWEKAMLAYGVRVDDLGLSPKESRARVDAWHALERGGRHGG